MLSHCAESGLVFNPKKFRFAKKEVEFAGFLLTEDGIKPTPRYIKSIEEFPTPTNITGVRSWFGLINQVAYCFSKTEIMAPFRKLLSPENPFEWTDDLEKAFVASKAEIIRLINDGVRSFDPGLLTCLSPDFSKVGTGWILQQKQCQCDSLIPGCCDKWKLVLAGGSFCNKAEENYPPIDGEALGIVKGLNATKYYTLGCNKLIVATDHKPLVPILNNKTMDEIDNPRLLKLVDKMQRWRFTTMWTPGRLHVAPDTMSRPRRSVALVTATDDDSMITQEIINPFSIDIVEGSTHMEVITWERVLDEQRRDKEIAKVKEWVGWGFPENSHEMEKEIRPFHQFRHILNDMLCYKDRIIIPTLLRGQILDAVHGAHQGVSGMIRRVEDSVFWPGINTDIIKKKGGMQNM